MVPGGPACVQARRLEGRLGGKRERWAGRHWLPAVALPRHRKCPRLSPCDQDRLSSCGPSPPASEHRAECGEGVARAGMGAARCQCPGAGWRRTLLLTCTGQAGRHKLGAQRRPGCQGSQTAEQPSSAASPGGQASAHPAGAWPVCPPHLRHSWRALPRAGWGRRRVLPAQPRLEGPTWPSPRPPTPCS